MESTLPTKLALQLLYINVIQFCQFKIKKRAEGKKTTYGFEESWKGCCPGLVVALASH